MAWTTIKKIEKIEQKTKLIDIQCEPHPNFYANDILVHNCTFCHESDRHVKYAVRTPRNCIEEICSLMPAGSLMVHDDIFPGRKWCKEYVELWKAFELPRIPFWMQTRADFVCKNPDIIEQLAEIGLTWVSLGIESNQQRILDFLDKGTTVAQNYKACDILHENGVNIFCDMIQGVPTETKEDVEANGEFLRRVMPAGLSPSIYTCYPGSKLYKYCINNDLFLDDMYSPVRAPYERKVKGIDYEWLFRKLGEFSGYKGPLREYIPKESTKVPEKKDILSARAHSKLTLEELPFSTKEPIMNPKLSVITVSFQRPELLTEAIRSLQDQHDKSWEAIIIDCSHNTRMMRPALKKLAEDDRVRIFRARSESISSLWNLGLDKARGKYITILDDDNRKKPGFVGTLTTHLDQNPHADAVGCFYDTIDAEGNVLGGTSTLASKYNAEAILAESYIDGGALVYRKEILDDIGWYDERLMTQEDWDFVIRLTHQTKRGISILHESLADYRVHQKQRMKHDIELGRIGDHRYITQEKNYSYEYAVAVVSPPQGRLTPSQNAVVNGITAGMNGIEWVKMVHMRSDKLDKTMLRTAPLVLNIAPFVMELDELRNIRKLGKFVANLHMEDPAAIYKNKEQSVCADVVITNDPVTVHEYEKLMGKGMVFVHPCLSLDDNIIKYSHKSMANRDIDVLFIGHPYTSRIRFMRKLLPKLFTITDNILLVGDGWNNEFPEVRSIPTQSPENAMEYMQRAKIVVCKERRNTDLGGSGDSLEAVLAHRGYFEAGSGAVVMLDSGDKHHSFGDAVVFYKGITELLDNIREYLSDPEGSELIGLKAAERAFKDFTYRSRITKLINAFRSFRYGFWVN